MAAEGGPAVITAGLERSLGQFEAGARVVEPDDPAFVGQRPRVLGVEGLAAQPWWPVPEWLSALAEAVLPAVRLELQALLDTARPEQQAARHGNDVSSRGEGGDGGPNAGWTSDDFMTDGRW